MFFKKNSLLIVITITIFFSCGGKKTPIAEVPILPKKKAFIVLRSEGDMQNIQNLKHIITTDFQDNNVATSFSTYGARQAWNQNSIFKTAYGEKYDYIILIDQVAKFTIDGKTQVGGKYQLRSYHVKSQNPDWLDLGQSTCNILITPSIQKFSRNIVRSIVGNGAAFKNHDFEYDDDTMVASTDDAIDITSSSKNLTKEIERLKKELEQEKQRTRLAEQEKQRIKNQLQLRKEAEKQKLEIAQLEAKRAIEDKRKREKEIAKAYAAKREEVKQREAEEVVNTPPVETIVNKAPTRKDKLKQRQEAKRRIAEQREEKRRKDEEALFKRAQERKAIAEKKRLEQEQKRAALKEERAIKKRLALEKRREAELEEEKEAAAKLALQEAKTQQEKRKAEVLKLEREAAERLAEQRRQEEQLRQQEEAAKLAAEDKAAKKREARLLEEQRKITEQKAHKQKEQRLAKAKLKKAELEAENVRQRIAEQERIVQQKKEESLKAKALAEAKKSENLKREEALKRKKEASKKAIVSKPIKTSSDSNQRKKVKSKEKRAANTSSKKVNAYIFIQGKASNIKQLEDLKDHIEFDFMFAKAKSEIEIFDENQSIISAASRSHKEANTLITIQQKEYSGDGKYTYEIKITDNQNGVKLLNKITQPYNLSVKSDLKTFSKEVTQTISN